MKGRPEGQEKAKTSGMTKERVSGQMEGMDKEIVGISENFNLSIWVPSESMGKVIGKRGAMIQHIQRETKTSCSIIQVGSGEVVQRWSPIVISGDPSKVFAAHDMIKDIVEEIDDAVAEFPVPNNKNFNFKFYSNGGLPCDAIKILSAETNVRIFVPERQPSLSSGDRSREQTHSYKPGRKLTMEGTVANIFKAVTIMAQALRSSRSPSIPQPQPECREIAADERANKTASKPRRMYEQYVNIPTTIIGLLLVRRDGADSFMSRILNETSTTATKLDDPIIPEVSEGDRDSSAQLTCVETFAVRGSRAETVELVYSCVQRIISGESIHAVVSGLRSKKPPSASTVTTTATVTVSAATKAESESESATRKSPSQAKKNRSTKDDEDVNDENENEDEDDDANDNVENASAGGGSGGNDDDRDGGSESGLEGDQASTHSSREAGRPRRGGGRENGRFSSRRGRGGGRGGRGGRGRGKWAASSSSSSSSSSTSTRRKTDSENGKRPHTVQKKHEKDSASSAQKE